MFLTQLYIISILFFFNIKKKKKLLPNIYTVYLFLLLFCFAAVDLSGANDKLTKKNNYNEMMVNKKQLFRGNPSRAIAHVCKNFIRELKQRRRRRQRERQKAITLD